MANSGSGLNHLGWKSPTPRIRVDVSVSNNNGLRPALIAYMAANGIEDDPSEFLKMETYRMWRDRLHEFLPVSHNP